MKKFLKRAFSLLMICVLVITAVSFMASAEDSIQEQIQDATAAIAELNAKKQELENKLAKIEDEIELAKAKKESYAERKQIVEEQLNLLNTSIELKNTEIAAKQAEIDENQRKYDATYSLFKDRLVAVYKNNTATNLSVLLGCNTFSEFLVTADNLAAISEHDKQMMHDLFLIGCDLTDARTYLETELASLEEDKQTQQELYNELAALYQEADWQLSSAEAMQTATEEDYAAIIAERERQEAIIDELMAQASDLPYVGGYYAWPVPGYKYISSGFGYRWLFGVYKFHGGIDIAGSGIYGKNIVASNTGQVTTAYYGTTGYGHYVIIDHGGGYKTLYGHMSAIYVTVGQWVAQGTPIGAVGSTGNSTGPHCHFEIRINGERTNPLDLVVR